MSTELSAAPNDELPAAPNSELIGARFWIRVGAQTIDTLIHWTVWSFAAPVILGVGLGIYAGVSHVDSGALAQKASSGGWYGYVAAALGFAFYHTVMEATCGATLGKRLFGLVVATTKGGPISFRAALGRSFAYYVDGLFFGIVAYDSMKPPLQQRLGDMWNSTMVLRRSVLTRRSVYAASNFGVALLLGLLSDSACYLLTALIKLA
jgi:uncharacterized RDD family membrane protein YckC